MTTPLPLDDPRWATLRHAKGTADDVPPLLRALAQPGNVYDAWDQLTERVCPETGEVYPAAHAAVPHVVALGMGKPVLEQAPFWDFVGRVAAAANPPPVDADLRAAYDAALAQAKRLAGACLVAGHEEHDALFLAATIAALDGDGLIARGIRTLDRQDDEEYGKCPACESPLYLILDGMPFSVEGIDNTYKKGKPRPVLAALAKRVRDAGHKELAGRIEGLEGKVECECEEWSPLLDVIVPRTRLD